MQAPEDQTFDIDDVELLHRFVTDCDETAFASLMSRHGPMVLSVCRRMLRHEQDAEDAFQATFLVLIHDPGRVAKFSSLGGWLHGVACRVALNARRSQARRKTHEAARGELLPKEREEDDLHAVLDEGLQRLPAKFREPLVHCYLLGKTNEEAARELSCPPGTMFSRLARGREKLRVELEKLGVTVSAGILASALALSESSLPAGLTASVFKAATTGVVPASIHPLTQGVLSMTFATKVKIVAVIVFTLALLGGGAAGYQWLWPAWADDLKGGEAEAAKLQGAWKVVELEESGQALPKEQFEGVDMQIVFEGNKVSIKTFTPDGKVRAETMEFKLDPASTPKGLDVTKMGQKILGIYEVNGDGMKLCIDRDGKSRPKGYKTAAGSEQRSYVLKRVP